MGLRHQSAPMGTGALSTGTGGSGSVDGGISHTIGRSRDWSRTNIHIVKN